MNCTKLKPQYKINNGYFLSSLCNVILVKSNNRNTEVEMNIIAPHTKVLVIANKS